MSALDLNKNYTVDVQGIKLNIDTFRNRESVTMFCHACSLLLADGQTVVNAQLCIDQNSVPFFKVNDKIEVNFSSYKPGKEPPYTFKFISVIGTAKQKENELAPVGYNPMVSGSVLDRALMHSVALYANVKVAAGKEGEHINKVINTAKIFKDYYTDNL